MIYQPRFAQPTIRRWPCSACGNPVVVDFSRNLPHGAGKAGYAGMRLLTLCWVCRRLAASVEAETAELRRFDTADE